jgi:hypothetical protein
MTTDALKVHVHVKVSNLAATSITWDFRWRAARMIALARIR